MDYGLGTTNIDVKTGIRYGVISQYSILQAWADSSEPEYPCETCDCGNRVDADGEITEPLDYCDAEALSYSYQGDGYEMATCLDSDVIVIKSPFFTYAPYCSPCVPGAGNLDGAADMFDNWPVEWQGLAWTDEACVPRTYCAGHDWFDPPQAPYPVYSVLTGRPVFPDSWYGR
jgi:hypothetical protein